MKKRKAIYASRPSKKINNMKHPAIAELCRGLMLEKKMSARAMARQLNIHHSTFQGYLAGRHRPQPHIRWRMARLVRVRNFEVLLEEQMNKRFGQFYRRVKAKREKEKQATEQHKRKLSVAADALPHTAKTAAQTVSIDAFGGLSEEERKYITAKLYYEKYELQQQRKKMAWRADLEACYHKDDVLAADLYESRLAHCRFALSFMEARSTAKADIIDRQRNEVQKLERMCSRIQLRVDVICNTAPIRSRLKMLELDEAIRLREVTLQVLGGLEGVES